VSKRLLLLAGGALAFWAVVAVPARHLGGGADAVAYSGSALLLCLVPMALTLAAADLALRRDPRTFLLAVLGGTGARMFLVLAGGGLLAALVPYYRDQAFWVWLLVCYLATLALDVALLLAGRPAERPGARAGSPADFG
jgi:hypothetical protein